MAGKGCPGLSMVLAAALMMYPVVAAGAAVGTKKVAPRVVVKAGPVSGTLIDAMGRPLKKVTVKVLAEDGKAVATTATGADGAFVLGPLAAGRYALQVGTKAPLNMIVAEEAYLSHVLVIVPPEATYAAGAMTTAARWTWVVVGGVAVATGITLPLALTGGGGDEEAPAAPTPTPTRRRRVSP